MQRAAKKKAGEGGVLTDDERRKLVSTETSLGMSPEARIPTAIAGLETFTLSDPRGDEEEEDLSVPDAESFFNLPNDDDEDEEDDRGRR